MTHSIIAHMLPPQQRRTLPELSADLDLGSGDAIAKRSAFWTMLTLSAVIAAAGVMADSTATVIGAMIIAPLSTPIMGVALGVVQRDRRLVWHSVRATALGAVVVVAIGAAFALLVPGDFNLLGDSQISSRVSPGLVDLIAAIATGFAGAVALSRRDVAAVLPGVAIAISLVPPLAVVGVCLGQGAMALAMGALVLFVSNFVALVLAGMLVFTVAGYATEGADASALSRRRATLAIATLLVVVLVPLAANTVGVYLVTIWTGRVQTAADEWLASTPGATVTGVEIASDTVTVEVQAPGDLPPVSSLMSDLEGRIPNGIPVVVTTSVGQNIDAGVVGS